MLSQTEMDEILKNLQIAFKPSSGPLRTMH